MDNSSRDAIEIRMRRIDLEKSIVDLHAQLANHEEQIRNLKDIIESEHKNLEPIRSSIAVMEKELREISNTKSELQARLKATLSNERDLQTSLEDYSQKMNKNAQNIVMLDNMRQENESLERDLRRKQDTLAKLIAEEHRYSPKKEANLIASKQIMGTKEHSILKDLIRKGESATLEFKSSLMTPTRAIPEVVAMKQSLSEITDPAMKKEQFEKIKNIENKIKNELEIEVIKTIAAFMNTKGGILLIGINDDGTISGIESDYGAFVDGKEYDKWLQHLKNLIRDHLHIESIAHIQAKAFSVENKTVSWIDVQKASGPVFMDYVQKGNNRTDFFFRALNTTEVLNPRHQIDYINSNWPPNLNR